MTDDPQPTSPDPRTANDDEAAGTTENGQSATAPAEGADDESPRTAGSPDA